MSVYTNGPQLTNVDMSLKKLTDIHLFTVCTENTEQIVSGLPNPTPVEGGGGYDFSRLKTSPWLPHVRVSNRVFSHSLDAVFKMYIHIIYSHFFTCTISKTL